MIVETGTGIQDANAYASLADLVSYCEDRHLATLDGQTDDQKTALIIRATDYIEATYKARHRALTATQGLQFPTSHPRAFAVVKRATLVLALEALANDLSPRIEQTVARTESKLDGVGMEVTQFEPVAVLDHYPQITAMLRDVARLRRSGVTSGRVTRDPWLDPMMPMGSDYEGSPLLDVRNGFGLNGWGVFGGWDSVQ